MCKNCFEVPFGGTFQSIFSVIGYQFQDFWCISGDSEKQLFFEGPWGSQSHHEFGDRYFVGAHGVMEQLQMIFLRAMLNPF